MKYAFTGTRDGLTPLQLATLYKVVQELPDVTEWHQGCCVGADEQSTEVVGSVLIGVQIHGHPGRFHNGAPNPYESQLAKDRCHVLHPEDSMFSRNRTLVNLCDALIAAPPCKPFPAQGGTRYTVDYAVHVGKPVMVIWPDGSTEDLSKQETRT